jgi:hypothetical protein
MRLRGTELFGATAILGGALLASACSGGEDYPSYNTGGAPSTGGTAPSTGGTAFSTGGFSTGGVATGGFGTATGGTNTGGVFGGAGKSSGGSNSGQGGSKSTGGSFGQAGSKSTGGSFGQGGSKSTGGSFGQAGSKSTGGSSTGGSGGAGTVAFSQIVTIIKSDCSSCHTNAEAPNLSTANPTTLYNTLTTVTVRQCGGNKLVTANDPSKSALLMLATGQCGTFRMPVTCTTNMCFSAANQATITSWIQSGAKNP